jgi:hypothetical protein
MTTMTVSLRLKIFVVMSIGVALTLSECFSMPSISSAVAQNQAQHQPAQPQSQQPSPGAAVVYQYQFNAFYAAMWNVGWFGYMDANYQPGQGIVWQITSSRSSGGPTTFERAFLKVNTDTLQWWRLEITGRNAKDRLGYEFLVGTDMKVQKVRYKDPGSGQIGEFVPDQSGQQGGPSQPTRQQLANYLVGTESVQVKAGTFTADHYSYTDPQGGYKGDNWTSKTVPVSMVKFTGTNPKNNVTSSGELVQIESGVTTILGSY